LDKISIDDLYNNVKIVEQEVKRNVGPSSSSGSQNMAFISTLSTSNNDDVSTVFGVSTASPQVSIANLSDAIVYAFLANQPNGSQLVHEDLEQIHEDDLEEIDLKWQLALLSMKAKRVPRNQKNKTRNQETTRRTVNVEDISSKAMVAIDRAGFDWGYMADDEAPTNIALMAFSDSEVYTNNTCSKTCLENYETLTPQYDELRVEFNKSEFNLTNYKRGLASVEEQLVHYKNNESLLNENIDVLKRDILIKDSKITVLKSKLEKISKEKDDIEIKIKKFENASQILDKLIRSQITNKSKRGLGYVSYNVVPPPHTGNFSPPIIDLSHTGLPEFPEPSVESYGVKPVEVVTHTSSVKISEPIKENNDAPLIEDWESEEEDKVASPPKIERNTVEPSVDKRERMVNGTNHSKVTHSANIASKAVLTRTGLKPVNIVRPVNPKSTRRHMKGNISYLTDFKEFNGGYVAFRKGAKGGKITGKGIIRTGKPDFEDVYFVKELKFNLFSVSQMCDKKNSVLFTDTECFVLSPDFKLADESHVLLKVPRKINMYSVDIKTLFLKRI
nr:ribonuclease H-like domain-containing protein [Tanacetum cinerariifolium]